MLCVQVLLRLGAHTESGLALDWNPAQPWFLATASRDKTVKVWDLAPIPAIASFTHTSNSAPSSSTPSTSRSASRNSSFSSNSSAFPSPTSGVSGGGGGGTAQHKPRFVLHTSTTVGHVSWRPVPVSPRLRDTSTHPHTQTQTQTQTQGDGRLGSNSSPTCTQLASTSSTERGEVSVWDISRSIDLPACVLRGHSVSEGCAGFVWLETQSPEYGEDGAHLSALRHTSSLGLNPSAPSAPSSSTAEKKRLHSLHGSNSLPLLSAGAAPLATTPSALTHTESAHNNTRQEISASHPHQARGEGGAGGEGGLLHRSGIFQHLFTIGKDGNVLVQDLRNAYFPGKVMRRWCAMGGHLQPAQCGLCNLLVWLLSSPSQSCHVPVCLLFYRCHFITPAPTSGFCNAYM